MAPLERAANYISSHQMEDLETQKRVMNLGRLLVNELNLDPGVDTLARWMAHYIAESMERAQSATGEEKLEAERVCFETILKLWKHRSSLPNGRRPFERFEPIFDTLEKLDPDHRNPFYFVNKTTALSEIEKSEVITESVQKWLDIATGIDQIVRIWLDYALKQAARCAADEKTLELIENSVDVKGDGDTSIILYLLEKRMSRDAEIDPEKLQKKQRELILSRIEKLKHFGDFNAALISLLEEELASMCCEDVVSDRESDELSHDDSK